MPLLKTHTVLFVFLAIATFASILWIDRYQQIGPDLLTNRWIDTTPGESRIKISDNELALYSSSSRIGARVSQDLQAIERGSVLLFSAEVKCDNVVRGRKPWNLARLVLIQNDGEKDLWNLPFILAALTGTHDWESYQNFFYITPETQSARVVAEIHLSTGSLQIRNLQLYPVNETATYLWVKKIILFAWGAFFLLLIGSCLFTEKRSLLFQLFLMSAFVSIVIGTSLPGYMKTTVMYEVEAQMDEISPAFTDSVPMDLSDVWHACIFLLLGLILSLMMKQVPFIHILAIIIMMAGGTEIMQLYIDGRTPQISDFFIDAVGGICGILLIRLLNRNRAIAPSRAGG